MNREALIEKQIQSQLSQMLRSFSHQSIHSLLIPCRLMGELLRVKYSENIAERSEEIWVRLRYVSGLNHFGRTI